MRNANGKTKAAKNGKTTELPPIDMENIVGALLNTPRLLNEARLRRDVAKADHDRYAAGLRIDATGALLFAGKGEGEKRAASSETERKWAADQVLATEPDYQALKAEHRAAERETQYFQDQLDCLQLVARLLISQARVR